MTPVEIDRRARAVWDDIAADTGRDLKHAQRVARLYGVCRDIQRAREAGAGGKTLMALGALVASVIANALSLRVAR